MVSTLDSIDFVELESDEIQDRVELDIDGQFGPETVLVEPVPLTFTQRLFNDQPTLRVSRRWLGLEDTYTPRSAKEREAMREWIKDHVPSGHNSTVNLREAEGREVKEDPAIQIVRSQRPESWFSPWLRENIAKVRPRQEIEIKLPKGYEADETKRRELERIVAGIVTGKLKVVKEKNIEMVAVEEVQSSAIGRNPEA